MNIKKFLNQSGFSLVEAVVATGVLAIASFGAVTLSNQQMGVVSDIKMKSSEIDFLYNMEKSIVNADICEATFINNGAVTVNQDPNNIVAANQITQVRNRDGDVLYEVGELYQDNRIRIDDMVLKNINITLDPDPNLRYGTAELELTLSRLNSYGDFETIKKAIQLNLQTDISGVVSDCYDNSEYVAEATSDRLCEQSGGVYDAATKTCNLSAACDLGTPENISQISTECFVTEFVENHLKDVDGGNPILLTQTGGGTINGSLTVTAGNVSTNVIHSPTGRVFVSGGGSITSTDTFTINGNLVINNNPAATRNDVFQSLSESDQESIINSIVTNISNTQSMDNFKSHFRSSISVQNCTSGQLATGFSINTGTGVISPNCQ